MVLIDYGLTVDCDYSAGGVVSFAVSPALVDAGAGSILLTRRTGSDHELGLEDDLARLLARVLHFDPEKLGLTSPIVEDASPVNKEGLPLIAQFRWRCG